MSDAVFLSRDEARALSQRVLKFSKADEARVSITSGWSGNSRFAGNEITTGGGTIDTTVSVTSTVGRKRASASTNVLDDASLARTVELSERLAKLSPDDPELMPELGPQQYADVNAFSQRTADLTPEARATAVARSLKAVADVGSEAKQDLFVAGFLEASAGLGLALASSRGLFAYYPRSTVDLSVTVRTPDGTGSGYAVTGTRDWADVDPAALGRRAARKAVSSRTPQAIEPGQYTVILEPRAVADVLPLLLGAFNARTNDEGRGTFSKRGGGTKIGEKIADERVTLFTDPSDPQLLTQPFDADGLPLKKHVFVENGVLKGLAYSRFWAQQKGVAPTGGGGGGGFGGGGGGGGGFGGGAGLKMMGGTKSVDELIAGTDRGILCTHFFYIRFLDQRTAMVTGLTRDGTFLIEKGKVTKPLKNFRWNESPLFMLNKLDDLGRAERVSAGLVLPALKVRDWNFTSLSDAV
jgi:predicted Zn-dependent protease